jgi:hypothetical protein
MKNSKPASAKGPWLWPLALAGLGLVLLLQNFLLLGDFNVVALLPLLLVVIGAQILLRGDFAPSADSRTFGITRGSVESAALQISAGEIDVELGALQREGRLIAGQYAPQSRPGLFVEGTHTTLVMERASTPWLFFADWQMGLARDLPWSIFISTHLGQVNADLSQIVTQQAVIATGIGDIRVIAPREAFGEIVVQSAAGNIHLMTPENYRAQIQVQTNRTFRVHADSRRYREIEAGVFVTHEAIVEDENTLELAGDENYPLVKIMLRGTFGDAYLS